MVCDPIVTRPICVSWSPRDKEEKNAHCGIFSSSMTKGPPDDRHQLRHINPLDNPRSSHLPPSGKTRSLQNNNTTLKMPTTMSNTTNIPNTHVYIHLNASQRSSSATIAETSITVLPEELEPLLPMGQAPPSGAELEVRRWQAELASDTKGQEEPDLNPARARDVYKKADRGEIVWRFPVWNPAGSLSSTTDEPTPVSPKTVPARVRDIHEQADRGEIEWHFPQWDSESSSLLSATDESTPRSPRSDESITFEEFCALAYFEDTEALESEILAYYADDAHLNLLTDSHVSSNEAGAVVDVYGGEHIMGKHNFTLDMLKALDEIRDENGECYHSPASRGEIEQESVPEWDVCPCCGEYYCDDCASEDSLG